MLFRAQALLIDIDGTLVDSTAAVVASWTTWAAADKKLQWIHGTTRCRDGYLEFQHHPEPMLGWLAKHMN
jgi:beta-phosphoglucomutase-like phosphatase (HAD superfamily)